MTSGQFIATILSPKPSTLISYHDEVQRQHEEQQTTQHITSVTSEEVNQPLKKKKEKKVRFGQSQDIMQVTALGSWFKWQGRENVNTSIDKLVQQTMQNSPQQLQNNNDIVIVARPRSKSQRKSENRAEISSPKKEKIEWHKRTVAVQENFSQKYVIELTNSSEERPVFNVKQKKEIEKVEKKEQIEIKDEKDVEGTINSERVIFKELTMKKTRTNSQLFRYVDVKGFDSFMLY